MKKQLFTIILALCVCSLPLMAVVSGRSLTNTLKDLCTELQATFMQRSDAQKRFNEDFDRQHKRMIDVITESNELSILLYTQEQEMTFDLAYALKKVTANYKDFSKDRRPYDRIVNGLNYEIDRNARLIEGLARCASFRLALIAGKRGYQDCLQGFAICPLCAGFDRRGISRLVYLLRVRDTEDERQ